MSIIYLFSIHININTWKILASSYTTSCIACRILKRSNVSIISKVKNKHVAHRYKMPKYLEGKKYIFDTKIKSIKWPYSSKKKFKNLQSPYLKLPSSMSTSMLSSSLILLSSDEDSSPMHCTSASSLSDAANNVVSSSSSMLNIFRFALYFLPIVSFLGPIKQNYRITSH